MLRRLSIIVCNFDDQMIDTHAHIYLLDFQDDLEEILKRAEEVGISQIVMPAIDSKTHELMLKVEERFKSCISMMGLHPCSVNADFEQELDIVNNYLEQRHFVAIGEIGLDFYWDNTYRNQQYEAFHQQIGIAIKKNLPVVIHSRNSIDECIEVLQQYNQVKGVFHCFSGSLQQAQKIIDLGFMIGIGGVVTFKNAGLDLVIKELGISNIILETDAPYLTPSPFRGKRNEPSYLTYIVEKISAVTGKTTEEVEQVTTSNARRLFDLK